MELFFRVYQFLQNRTNIRVVVFSESELVQSMGREFNIDVISSVP